MLKRGVMLLGGLSAAVGVPMAISGGESGEPGILSKLWSNVAGGDKSPDSATSPTAGNPLSRIQPASQPGTPQAATAGMTPPELLGPRIDGHPVFDPAEVFRFDVSPAWIMSRWARVSTIPVPPDLQGFRVPLVTGPSPRDLAGSLTYYFNSKDAVQRITFVGTTGDPTTLANLVTKRFRFAAVPSPMPNEWLYQIRWHNQPRSELRLRLSDIVRADAPYQRFDVDMEINLPDVPPSRPLTTTARR
jgi:hypothetical protein